ncbi:MAG: VIT1/CCC1 transporter family protein [Candidatus Nitrosocosmicus sp.]|uniref:VIT1/CCC1 transporter family protein n=1 Tax=Candidatus Nitrosocosmicus agrestis TaxID=2563600 RepID=UPI0019175CDA|nr:VIT1/CCC1 transporter family protein [Candidatus Nitrosocosmicus sp. SS]MDR4489592.1 VIT1/CCC1 transporter family protein [Candidatus Nitrosocosmicus sp.]HET6589938.1 VIT1/CCC1 transporter family protein [Candidatus Nitrosocosmicus sp.]
MNRISDRHVEPHIKESSYIRDVVFGFGDGVNTSLGIVAGIGGATIGVDIVILAAIIGMFTGAKAMAVQNYLAVKSQKEILESEIEREEYEIENKPEDERKEIEQIYKAKGFEGDELKLVVDRITSDKKIWLKTMLTEELGLNLEIIGNPIKGAIVMFVSFLIGGVLPILPYFIVKIGFINNFVALMIAISISLASSFIIGAIKGRLAKKSWIKGGLEMSLLGTGIALLGYGIGSEMNNLGVVNFE